MLQSTKHTLTLLALVSLIFKRMGLILTPLKAEANTVNLPPQECLVWWPGRHLHFMCRWPKRFT